MGDPGLDPGSEKKTANCYNGHHCHKGQLVNLNVDRIRSQFYINVKLPDFEHCSLVK